MQTLLAKCPRAHRSPDPSVIVDGYSYNGTGIKEIWLISTVWLNWYSPRESVEYHALKCHSVVGSEQLVGYVWLLLRPPADSINSGSVGLTFCSHM